MSDITDSQILQALKDKAKLYAKMASDFERALNGALSASASVSAPNRPLPLGIEQVRDYLRVKGGRPGDLAKHLGCTPDDIMTLVNQPNSGVKTVERGWLKLETTPG